MKIKKQYLIDILSLVNPGLANKAVIEQSDCFIFQGGRVYTYNDEISISHPIDLDVEGAVNGGKLLTMLKKSNDEEVDVFVESGQLRVHGKKSKAGIRMDEDVKLPFNEGKDNVQWEQLPENFCEAVKFCLFSTSKDASRPLLTCVHINGNIAESCDNFRLTQYALDKEVGEYLIPAEAAKSLIVHTPVSVALIDGWLHFALENDVLFCCRTFADTYPDISKIMVFTGEDIKWSDGLPEAIDRAGVFGESQLKGAGSMITITISEGRLFVRGEGDYGFLEEEMRIRFAGEAKFIINAEFFMEILRYGGTSVVGKQKLKFTGNKWTHVVSLLPKN